jgi:polyisoprenoid-binding protein YceI
MNFSTRVIIGVAGIAATLATATANDIYRIDSARSSIEFRLSHMMGKVNGKFKKFEGKIDIDREHPQQSSVTVKIQVDSIDTGIAKRDTHLSSEEFFNAAKYPEITFKSRNVKQTGPQSGDILGDLTIHGATKPITLHVKLVTPLKDGAAMQNSRWEVTSEPIKRGEFGLMFSSGLEAVSMIGQQVMAKIVIEAVKQ